MSYKEKPVIILYRYTNDAFEIEAIIDDYESLSITEDKYQANSFTLDINFNIPNSHLFKENSFIQFSGDDKLYIVTRITDAIGSEGKESQNRQILGRDFRFIFKRRIIKYLNNNDTWTYTGSAELCMRNLIDSQCGLSAPVKRQLPVINVIPEEGIGDQFTVSESYTNLYEVLVNIATQTDIGWNVKFANGQLELEFYQGIDRHATVRFDTDYESLSDGSYTESSENFSNVAYIGGQGMGENKDIYEGELLDDEENVPSGLDRFECWSDNSSLTTESEYKEKSDAILREYSDKVSLSGNGLSKCPYVYKEHYNVGDIITVAFSDKTAEVQVLSVTEHWSKGSYDLDFDFGKSPNDLSRQLNMLLTKIQNYQATSNSTSKSNVKYYNIPTENQMPKADVILDVIGFIGDVGDDGATFTLYFDPVGKCGAKKYHVYFKQLEGSGKLTLTTGVQGADNLIFETGTYVAIIYVDSEGNIKCQGALNDAVSSPNSSYSSQKVDELISQGGGGDNTPIGTIFSYGGTNVPVGYILCDGRAVSRTDYDKLFEKIGTTFGSGDGSTTFNVPDLREVNIVGAGENTTLDIASHDVYTLGQFKDDQLQAHKHAMELTDEQAHENQLRNHPFGGKAQGSTYFGDSDHTPTPDTSYAQISDSTNGRSGTTTHGKQVAVNFIIKATASTGEIPTDVELDDDKTTTANVWSASKTNEEIENAVEEVDNKNNYSTTEEIVVGKWIDGKPIYNKVIDVRQNNKGVSNIELDINYMNIDTLINANCIGNSTDSYSGAKWVLNSVSGTGSREMYLTDNGKLTSKGSEYKFFVILEYTKTTDIV